MIKKLYMAFAAAGLLSLCAPAMAQNRLLQTAPGEGIKIQPIRVAKAKGLRLANGEVKATMVGDWVPYTGTGTDIASTMYFDNDERTPEPLDENVAVPTSDKYGRDCAAEHGIGQGFRWYFGPDFHNPVVVNDLRTAPGGAGKLATWWNIGWFWNANGGTERCIIGVFTDEEFSEDPNTPPDGTTTFDGVVYDFGDVPGSTGGYYYTNVDLTGAGFGHQMPADGNGGYWVILARDFDGTTFTLASLAQVMLWGTKAANPSQQGPLQWDTDAGFFELWDYTFGVCPDPLGACSAFWADEGAGALEVRPNAMDVDQGDLLGGGVPELQEDDDQVVNIRQRAQFSPALPNVGLRVRGTLGSGIVPSQHDIKVRCATTGLPLANIIFRVEAKQASGETYTQLFNGPPSGTGEQEYNFSLTGGQATLHTGPLGECGVRLRWFDRGTISPAWRSTVDLVRWFLTP